MHPSSPSSKAKHWIEQHVGDTTPAPDRATLFECLYRLSGSLRASYGQLTETHWLNLLSNRWLCDEHLNACGEYINKKTACNTTKILSTFFIQNLRDNQERHPAVWSPQKPYEVDKLVTQQVTQTLLIPVHTPGHWSLVVVDIPARTYLFTDSLDLQSQEAPGDVALMLNW
ncbi:hypothetical protein FRC12_000845 [Ceratobasidium sp. 428]|nr:hypothetical protein FRC12_000845 [Ceratobasidium sp. 428]